MKSPLLYLSAAALLLSCSVAAQGPAYPYSVTLNWTLSTSVIASQNIYRAPYTTTCGTFVKLNTAPVSSTATSYSDTTVVPNQVYCYEVTAVSALAGESAPSNLASNVQIPPAPDTALTAVTQ